jgi:purine-binding chemotaxis protein CheW
MGRNNQVKENNVEDTRPNIAKKLAQRAQNLAQALKQETLENANDSIGENKEILVFMLSGERYALKPKAAIRISSYSRLTILPGVPDHVMGIMNIDGELLPIVDLRPLLGIPKTDSNSNSRIIHLENPAMRFGLYVDSIQGISTFSPSEIRPILPTMIGIKARYVQHILEDGTILIDADALLADTTLIVNDE